MNPRQYKRFEVFVMLLIGICFAIGGIITFGRFYYYSAGPLAEETTIVFKRGTGFREIVEEMHDKEIIRHPWLFASIAVVLGDARQFKAGEYQFSAAISPRLIMDMIAEGRVVVHRITVPEGLTVREVQEFLAQEKALEGEIATGIKEGTLLPDTFHFTYGDHRQDIVSRMQAGMTAVIAELWPKRQEGLPFKTPEEAITLASIVEKETGVASERGRVAAVFINRLRKGMKLQSDPTVAYGIEHESGRAFTRTLTTADLKKESIYNTYIIAGLPPGPISNPGRAAIEAVLNPPTTKELYFVATGTGGHNFSSTLDQHNNYVRQYRQKMKQSSATPAKKP